MPKVIHDMGLGARSFETILEVLRSAKVRRVVDVRRYPTSGRFPHHAAASLHPALAEHGFEVVALGDLLGGDRTGGYEAWMRGGGFRRGMDRLEAIAAAGPTMILCAEREAGRCHRRHIARALEERGWTLAHHGRTLTERTARGEMRLVRKTG